MQRNHVTSTLIRRHFYAMRLLGTTPYLSLLNLDNCTARQCSPLRRKFMECSIINAALSVLIKHLVIGQRQEPPNFSGFHLSPRGILVSIGQHLVTMRVEHLPKRTETSLITEAGLTTESD